MPADPRLVPFPVSGLDDLPPALRGAHVAIGNFDGMHRGHQAVLDSVTAAARAAGRPVLLLTFEPHPRDVFRPDRPVFRLTPPAAKARIAAALGLDGMVAAPFDADFAALTADDFIERVLINALGVAGVAVGWNFHFGAGRTGNTHALAEAGRRFGFSVEILDAYRSEDDETVSSTRIRDLLAAGEIAEAAGLLGYRWFFDGTVIGGDRRGRTIGYPTANMRLASPVRLAHGIYAVVVEWDGIRRHGVASFGRRPTFDNGDPVFETFVFDYTGDLYGRTLTVTPVARLRDEMKFDSVDALVARMDLDSAEARALLAGLAPVSPLDRDLLFD